jgi:uroporphyrin-III C-methyltransferase
MPSAGSSSRGSAAPGTVYLVGAGPGDPELLTVKARRLLGEADAVVYDQLVSPEVLAAVRADCERVFAGKKGGGPGFQQDDIDAMLVRLAREGKIVVRLKGGDPFVFGRGGEEAEYLASSGVPFEIVPGITAALGAAAYAGIPLTHRASSSAVVFLTGHEDPSKANSSIRWEEYARLGATLCIYMGMRNLAGIVGRLQEGGMAGDTPAAIIQEATTGRHRVIVGTLATIAARATAEHFEAPAVVVIGDVVAHADRLAWFGPARAAAVGPGRT